MDTEITNASELYQTLLKILEDPGVNGINFSPRILEFITVYDSANESSDVTRYLLKRASEFMNNAMINIPEFYRYSLSFDSNKQKLFMDLYDTDVFRYEFGFGHNDILSSIHWYYIKDLRARIDAVDCPDKEPMETLFKFIIELMNKIPSIRNKHIDMIANGMSAAGFKVELASHDSSIIYLVS